jgi:hypothetical protein
VLELIADYQRAARALVGALRQLAQTDDLLSAWHSGRIAESGRMELLKARYRFHGVGCRFEIGGRIVDVDFGPDGRHDGFDAWRLVEYANSAFEWQGMDQEQIESALNRLKASGAVRAPQWPPSQHLLYLSEDLTGSA